MKKTKIELILLNEYLPTKYYGHEARNNAVLFARKLNISKEVEIKLIEEQTYYRCPNCDIWLSNADGSDEEDDYTDNYCPNCGSKINWK